MFVALIGRWTQHEIVNMNDITWIERVYLVTRRAKLVWWNAHSIYIYEKLSLFTWYNMTYLGDFVFSFSFNIRYDGIAVKWIFAIWLWMDATYAIISMNSLMNLNDVYQIKCLIYFHISRYILNNLFWIFFIFLFRAQFIPLSFILLYVHKFISDIACMRCDFF